MTLSFPHGHSGLSCAPAHQLSSASRFFAVPRRTPLRAPERYPSLPSRTADGYPHLFVSFLFRTDARKKSQQKEAGDARQNEDRQGDDEEGGEDEEK